MGLYKQIRFPLQKNKKACIFLLAIGFLLMGNDAIAQQARHQIRGTILNARDQASLIGATVYLNNTTIGTTTSDKGTFILPEVPSGTYELIVSYVGFKTQSIPINTQTLTSDLAIRLQPASNQLKMITVKPTKQKNIYFRIFEKYFLGHYAYNVERNAGQCKIENPEVLSYDFDDADSILRVSATKPLIIINNNLGYKIYYALQYFDFNLRSLHLQYFGYCHFDTLPVKNNQQKKKWERDRYVIYLRSMRSFMKALRDKQLTENGYMVSKFVKSNTDTLHSFSTAMLNPFSDYYKNLHYHKGDSLYPGMLPYDSLISVSPDGLHVTLNFNNSLYIVSNKIGVRSKSLSAYEFFPSIITLTKPHVEIDESGVLSDPMGITIESIWAYRQISSSDYHEPER